MTDNRIAFDEEFVEKMRERHAAGYAEYGDRSYSREPQAIAGEMQEECVDQGNWAQIAYRRIEKLKQQMGVLQLKRDALEHGAARAEEMYEKLYAQVEALKALRETNRNILAHQAAQIEAARKRPMIRLWPTQWRVLFVRGKA